MPDKHTVVVVDDKDLMRDSLAETLRRAGYEVLPFASGEDALEAVRQRNVDAVITDLKMPGLSGLDVLSRCRQIAPELPVVLITAFGTVESAVTAMKRGAFDYIKKPFEPDEIELVVKNAVERKSLLSENECLRAKLNEQDDRPMIVGVSGAMREIVGEIEKVAPISSTVLIYGESGTGKEIIAREIHLASSRRDKPMLAVNCAALSAGLLESELFGHEKGAFTGADRMRKGRFELADGGTLLLDEVSEIDITLQAKLLRVLQEKSFERVGSSTSRRVDVRVIATTNRDLPAAMREGRFREDLYFRLNVLPLRVPPLREHMEDLPALIEHFMAKFNKATGKRIRSINDDTVDLLRRYHWPGNIRELENIIERATVLANGDTITAKDISPSLDSGRAISAGDETEIMTVEEMERRLTIRVLERYGWHQKRSAEVLGVGVRTLREKMKKWDLSGRQKLPA